MKQMGHLNSSTRRSEEMKYLSYYWKKSAQLDCEKKKSNKKIVKKTT